MYTPLVRPGFALVLLTLALARAGSAAEEPLAAVTLEVKGGVVRPGEVPEAAPPRFVMLEDGQVFVGGTREVGTAQLDRAALDDLDRQLAAVRKLPALGSEVRLGDGPRSFHLVVRRGKALEVTAVGEPATAPAALRPLATLLGTLADFDPPSLRPWRPAAYWLAAREGTLAGGCREWGFEPSLADALASARLIPESATRGWPTGATPASVCAGDKRYVVTLRPVVPGAKP